MFQKVKGGAALEGVNNRVGLEGVLAEQDGEVRVASVRNELIGDVRHDRLLLEE